MFGVSVESQIGFSEWALAEAASAEAANFLESFSVLADEMLSAVGNLLNHRKPHRLLSTPTCEFAQSVADPKLRAQRSVVSQKIRPNSIVHVMSCNREIHRMTRRGLVVHEVVELGDEFGVKVAGVLKVEHLG